MNLNTAEWIIAIILVVTLFVFLVLAIILLAKIIGLTKDAKQVIATSQQIADKADDVAGNIKDMTSIGGVVKTFASSYVNNKTAASAAEARKSRSKAKTTTKSSKAEK
ncbi:hypothetical protein IKF33_01745 [Candidatus Saccharibacteria bacterium]|nr:hypothetical protein [Candidatus Saccharibacteria bacterium]